MLIQEENVAATDGRTLNERVGYLALWGGAIMKNEEKNPCDGLAWYTEECTDLSGWHASTNFDSYTDGETCTVLVKTKGGTCKNFCNS